MTNFKDDKNGSQGMSPNDWRGTLGRLLREMVDVGQLDATQQKELVAILQSSDEAKRYYLSYLQIHTELGNQWGVDERPLRIRTDGFTGNSPTPSIADPVRRETGSHGAPRLLSVVGWLALGLAASCLFVVQLLGPEIRRWISSEDGFMARDSNVPQQVQPLPVDPAPSAQSSDVAIPSEIELPTNGWTDAAVIVRNEGISDASLQVGKRLSPGTIRFDTGTLQLQFMSGASMVLAGPAELQIESEKSAKLLSGVVKTRVNDRAKGFVLNTSKAAVVDIGTEFDLRFDKDGQPEVEVFEGEVEFSLLGPDGSTMTSRRLLQSEVVGVAKGVSGEAGLEDKANVGIDGPRIELPMIVTPCSSPEYSQTIRAGKPLVYWRFESETDGLVANEMSDRWAAQIVHSETQNHTISINQGCLQLKRSVECRHVNSIEPIHGLDDDEFTVEFWMNPEDLEHSHCVGLTPFLMKDQNAYLGVVEIVTDTFLIHQPGSLRILYRDPPHSSYHNGVNVFSPGMVTPGQWHHVAMVNSAQSLGLYLNGELIRSLDSSVDSSERNEEGFRIILGQLTTNTAMRQFAGAIDEFALYGRALDSSEIRQHYRAAIAVE